LPHHASICSHGDPGCDRFSAGRVLANGLAARFHIERERNTIARAYLTTPLACTRTPTWVVERLQVSDVIAPVRRVL